MWAIEKNVIPDWAKNQPNSIQCNKHNRQIFARTISGQTVLHTYPSDERYQLERNYARNWAKLAHKHVTFLDVEAN